MAGRLPGTSLGDYGSEVFERDHFTCVYCGFDGRLFDNWMQLSVDHQLHPICRNWADPPRETGTR